MSHDTWLPWAPHRENSMTPVAVAQVMLTAAMALACSPLAMHAHTCCWPPPCGGVTACTYKMCYHQAAHTIPPGMAGFTRHQMRGREPPPWKQLRPHRHHGTAMRALACSLLASSQAWQAYIAPAPPTCILSRTHPGTSQDTCLP